MANIDNLNFNGSMIDRVNFGGNSLLCLKWNGNIVWQRDKLLERYYWKINSQMPVNHTFSLLEHYFFTLSDCTSNGNSLFGMDKTMPDNNDFRVFYAGSSNHIYFDSGNGRQHSSVSQFTCNDFLCYDMSARTLKVYKGNTAVWSPSITSGYQSTVGKQLYFVSQGSNESLNFYEFKVYDVNNNLSKHYIPLEDGHTLYDVVSNTKFDVGKTYSVFVSTHDKNAKGEDIPLYQG